MNYHPFFLAQHFVGRLKAFPEDFPSLAVSAHMNFSSTHPISSVLGIDFSAPPAPQLSCLLQQGHLRQAMSLWGDTACPCVLTVPVHPPE